MNIASIETATITAAWGPPENGETREWPIVLVHSEDGTTGIGRGGDAETINTELAPLLAGEDPKRIAMLWERMYEAAWRYRGPGMAAMASIGAVDVALWDLYGKSCGEPVWRLLGGHRDRVTVYADGIGYADQPPDEVAALVKKHADLGYDAVKIHLTSPDADVALEKVRLSREALGPDRKLLLDVWSMWDGEMAAEMARRFAPYNLYWIEEPVRRDDELSYLRMVRDSTDALLAGGEGQGTLYGARRLITEGGLQLLQTDILVGGGFTGLMRIAAMAEAHHVPISPHGAQYPEINCHLVAAAPNGLMVPACPESEPYQVWSRMYAPGFKIAGGQIEMTDKPGLGLELDDDLIRVSSTWK